MSSTTRRRCTTALLVLLVAGTGAANIAPTVARAQPAPSHAAVGGPKATLSPGSGPAGAAIAVRGAGFAPDENVSVWFDDAFSSTAASATGTVALRIAVPTAATPGAHQVYFTGNRSHRSTTVPFLVRDDWAQAGGTAEHALAQAASSDLLTPANVDGLERSWEAGVGHAGAAGAAVVADGSVYVGAGGTVTALDERTGATRWTAVTGSPVAGSPAVVEGNVVVALRNGTVLALGVARGGEAWRYVSGSTGRQGVAVIASTVYAGFANGALVAFDAVAGTRTWTAAGTGAVTSVPTVGGNVVVVARGAELAGYTTATGALRWTTALGSANAAIPSYSAFTRTLLVSTARSGLYGLDVRDGRVRWHVAGLTSSFATTTVFGAAWVLRSTGDTTEIVVVDPATGRVAEVVGTVPGRPTSGLTRAGDLLVLTTDDGTVLATRAFADSTPMVRWSSTGGAASAPVAVVDGSLVFATTAGTVVRYQLG